jgi:hypothetical protein
VAKHGSEDDIERHVRDVVVGCERPALGRAALELPQLDHGRGGCVDAGAADLGDESRRHQMVDEVAVVLEAGIARQKLDVLLGQDAADQLPEEARMRAPWGAFTRL